MTWSRSHGLERQSPFFLTLVVLLIPVPREHGLDTQAEEQPGNKEALGISTVGRRARFQKFTWTFFLPFLSLFSSSSFPVSPSLLIYLSLYIKKCLAAVFGIKTNTLS